MEAEKALLLGDGGLKPIMASWDLSLGHHVEQRRFVFWEDRMTCAICGERVRGIGLDPLRRGEVRVCLSCLGKHGLAGIKEILRRREEK